MTDSAPVAAAGGPPETSRPARPPTGPAAKNLTAVAAANFTSALPYILVPVLFILSVIFIPGYFSKASIISLLILASLLGLSSLGQTMTIRGTSLLGGRGGYLRTVMGALIVAELTTLLVGVGFNASFQELALGILVILLTSSYGRELKVAAKI